MVNGIAIAALIMGTISLITGIIALIELRSFNKSTHRVEYIQEDPFKELEPEPVVELPHGHPDEARIKRENKSQLENSIEEDFSSYDI